VLKPSLAAVDEVILKVELVAVVNPDEEAVSVYPVPMALIESVLKVAIPLEAPTMVVPESVPPPALVPIPMEIEADDPVTVLPPASSIVTWMLLQAAPAVLVPGCTVNASLFAVPEVMLKAELVAVVRLPEVAVKV
jgi:hypothetical protein